MKHLILTPILLLLFFDAIAQNGSVYAGSISQVNLVVRWDGVVGLAGLQWF